MKSFALTLTQPELIGRRVTSSVCFGLRWPKMSDLGCMNSLPRTHWLTFLAIPTRNKPRKWLAYQSVQVEVGSGRSSACTGPTRTEPIRALHVTIRRNLVKLPVQLDWNLILFYCSIKVTIQTVSKIIFKGILIEKLQDWNQIVWIWNIFLDKLESKWCHFLVKIEITSGISDLTSGIF